MNKLLKVLSIVIAGFALTANSFAADVTMRISIQLPMKKIIKTAILKIY